ncbi:MAG: SIMPL domain-containing protein [Rhodocyclaceae bacterium]|nr:SIMPL domain-containing protein [Rhodocyclaceae bacterium]MCP5231607.1 SIMPL domain-containing protein [Zoogloeaceae bacterium]MCB1911672.1 SIMPL domain-containing protein [Rhodocyclaceae bacterium]MCP5254820.1 SIMPL domain-containing protein [Zoogloeaceae bacterium]MCP5294452.1 SIMPL domain-containing protein [Zoogloeaceae bacterium]
MPFRFSCPLLFSVLMTLPALGVLAAEPVNALPAVDLVAEGSAEAANDLATAVAYFEATDANPASLADKVNKVVAKALVLTKDFPNVKVSSAGTNTYPVYNRDGRTLEAWRMRSQIQLESRDVAAMSALIGKLQASLAVSQISLQPAPETRRAAENQATVEALADFRRRAQLVADTLGRKYRIARLSINQSGGRPPVYMRAKVAMASAEVAPSPIEAGESTVSVNINGTVELID